MSKKKGPAIHVTFEVVRGHIQQIELRLHEGPGLAWEVLGASSVTDQIESWLEAYCRKQPSTQPLPLQLQGRPPFTKKIHEVLQGIPYGQTLSYKEVATLAGNPKAARAVGQVCGRNPYPLVIPCHRVLASDKSIGGFSCGLAIKERLLAFEAC